jgi:hypothetical protein
MGRWVSTRRRILASLGCMIDVRQAAPSGNGAVSKADVNPPTQPKRKPPARRSSARSLRARSLEAR